MNIEEYKALAGKPKKKPPNRKQQTGKEQMDLTTSNVEEALSAITINSKADYAEYEVDGTSIEFRLRSTGKLYRATIQEIKP